VVPLPARSRLGRGGMTALACGRFFALGELR